MFPPKYRPEIFYTIKAYNYPTTLPFCLVISAKCGCKNLFGNKCFSQLYALINVAFFFFFVFMWCPPCRFLHLFSLRRECSVEWLRVAAQKNQKNFWFNFYLFFFCIICIWRAELCHVFCHHTVFLSVYVHINVCAGMVGKKGAAEPKKDLLEKVSCCWFVTCEEKLTKNSQSTVAYRSNWRTG